jgi:hypothetical protein
MLVVHPQGPRYEIGVVAKKFPQEKYFVVGVVSNHNLIVQLTPK